MKNLVPSNFNHVSIPSRLTDGCNKRDLGSAVLTGLLTKKKPAKPTQMKDWEKHR